MILDEASFNAKALLLDFFLDGLHLFTSSILIRSVLPCTSFVVIIWTRGIACVVYLLSRLANRIKTLVNGACSFFCG